MTTAKRVVGAKFLPKLLWFGLLALGLSHRSSALILTAVIWVACALIFRHGLREQVQEPEEEGYVRRWTELVWSHSVWINPGESPADAIKRLAGPWERTPQPKARPTKRHQAIWKRKPLPIRQPCRYCPRGAVSCSGHGITEG